MDGLIIGNRHGKKRSPAQQTDCQLRQRDLQRPAIGQKNKQERGQRSENTSAGGNCHRIKAAGNQPCDKQPCGAPRNSGEHRREKLLFLHFAVESSCSIRVSLAVISASPSLRSRIDRRFCASCKSSGTLTGFGSPIKR